MREIKFRAWDGEKMFIPDYIGGLSGLPLMHMDWGVPNEYPWEITLMQFTGLKDWYEGDILKLPSGNIRVVVWDNGAFHLRVPNWEAGKDMPTVPLCLFVLSPDATAEVVGNIYEHSHLLK